MGSFIHVPAKTVHLHRLIYDGITVEPDVTTLMVIEKISVKGSVIDACFQQKGRKTTSRELYTNQRELSDIAKEFAYYTESMGKHFEGQPVKIHMTLVQCRNGEAYSVESCYSTVEEERKNMKFVLDRIHKEKQERAYNKHRKSYGKEKE